jgi:hypothetical protein
MTRHESHSPASGSFFSRGAERARERVAQRRWAIAIALSIALNEIFIGFLHWPRPAQPAPDVKAVRVVLERPRPTPRPTARPTPRPIVPVPPRATIAPKPQVAAPKAAGYRAPHPGGAPARPIRHVTNFDVYAQLAKSRLGRAAGVKGSGTGTGSGAGAGGGASGTAGSGSGAAGNGNGTVNADTPCGEVVFNVRGTPEYRDGSASERVTATVSFPDGHTETDTFPYAWTYANGERDDPWSSTNLANKDFDIPLVFPPPGTDTSTFPPLIRYILDHTRSNGTTVLEPCPHAAPLPAH